MSALFFYYKLFSSYFHAHISYAKILFYCITEAIYKNRIAESDFTIFCQNVFAKDMRVSVFLIVLMIFDISTFLFLPV